MKSFKNKITSCYESYDTRVRLTRKPKESCPKKNLINPKQHMVKSGKRTKIKKNK
jgi:hypothetical protein